MQAHRQPTFKAPAQYAHLVGTVDPDGVAAYHAGGALLEVRAESTHRPRVVAVPAPKPKPKQPQGH